MGWLRGARLRRRPKGRHAAALPADRSWLAAVPEQPDPAHREAVADRQAPGAGVLLGFSDGSELSLASTDPRAAALRTVADLLVQDRARTADTETDTRVVDAAAADPPDRGGAR